MLSLLLFSQSAAHEKPEQQMIMAKVKGIVLDSVSGNSIPYATVSVVDVFTKQYILRTITTTDGEFEVEVPLGFEVCFVFESVMVLPEYIPMKIDKPEMDLGEILLNEAVTEMDEVTVSAQRPLVKSSIDRVVYDVEADPESATSSTLDMLIKVPLLTVDQDDNIKVKGSTKYQVHINGKASSLVATDPAMALKSIPASTIERIEVITEPGAKYDAEGLDGIINIVTKSVVAGYITSINASANTFPGAGGGIYFTTKVGKFGMSFNGQYNYNSRKYFGSSLTEYKQSETTKYNDMVFGGSYQSQYFYGNLEASYEFDSKRLLSLTVGGNGNVGDGESNTFNNRVGFDGDTISSYIMNKTDDNLWSGLSTSLDYQRSFDKKDQNLTLSYLFNYNPNNTYSISDVDGVNYSTYVQKIDSRANSSEHTFQVDYTEPFADKHVMEVGAKYILRQNKSLSNSYLLDTTYGEWVDDYSNVSDDIYQTQHIIGAYGSYSLRLMKWNFRAGARVEYMMQDVANQDTVFNNLSLNVIPNVNISYQPTQNHHLSLGYTQRLSRPGIWYLNPFYNNSDPYNVSQGNPNLSPELGHSLSFSYGYYSRKLYANTSLSGMYVNNSIESVTSMINDSTLYTTYENIGTKLTAFANIYLQWSICKWATLWSNINGSYLDISSNSEDLVLQNSGWSFNANGGMQFSLPWKLNFGAAGGYGSPRVSLQGTTSGYYHYTLSLRRAFLKDKLSVVLRAQTFAEEYVSYTSVTETDLYRQENVSSPQARNFSVSVSYRFGEMKENVRKVDKTIKNDDLLNGDGKSAAGVEQNGNNN